MKEKEIKSKTKTSLSVKIMSAFLAVLMLAGTVFMVISYIISK